MNIKSILSNIGHFLKGLLPWAKNAVSHGRDIATEIKEIADNPGWDVVVSFTSTKLDNAALAIFRTFMTSLLKDLNLADKAIAEGDKIGVVLREASDNIKAMQTLEAKAGTLNTISAAAATKIAELKGMKLPIESALSVAQPAYFHPELLEKD